MIPPVRSKTGDMLRAFGVEGNDLSGNPGNKKAPTVLPGL